MYYRGQKTKDSRPIDVRGTDVLAPAHEKASRHFRRLQCTLLFNQQGSRCCSTVPQPPAPTSPPIAASDGSCKAKEAASIQFSLSSDGLWASDIRTMLHRDAVTLKSRNYLASPSQPQRIHHEDECGQATRQPRAERNQLDDHLAPKT